MVDFICMGLLELQETQSKRETQYKFFCPQWVSNPVPSVYEADALPIAPRDPISTLGLNLPAFYVFMCYLPFPCGIHRNVFFLFFITLVSF